MSQPNPAPQQSRQFIADVVMPPKVPQSAALPPQEKFGAVPTAHPVMTLVNSHEDDVIELPEGQSGNAAIIAAVLRGAAGHWIECPVKPPMCHDATVAVGRDRRLLIIAVAEQGLSDLRSIGRVHAWIGPEDALVAVTGRNRFEPGSLFRRKPGRDRVQSMLGDVCAALATLRQVKDRLG